MPLSLEVYRLNGTTPEPITPSGMDEESRLQDILADRIEIIDQDLMVVGREVQTPWQARVDILAIDSAGHLVVIELKRNQTPREVVAQALEYGSWVIGLDNAKIAEIYANYLQRYHPSNVQESLDEAFRKKFRIVIPDELNEDHRLLIIAAELDSGTERIVEYLTQHHSVPVNAIFFRVFKDGGQEYLTRAWLREPDEIGEISPAQEIGEWNGEFYANFGHSADRDWEDARKYGFISAGGGEWYTKPLRYLKPGSRVWVNIPGHGYAGVGMVNGEVRHVSDFKVNGQSFLSLQPNGKYFVPATGNVAESSEYVVPVDWIHTVPVSEAVKERGFYGNQWTVTLSPQPKWQHTVERLKSRWGIKDNVVAP